MSSNASGNLASVYIRALVKSCGFELRGESVRDTRNIAVNDTSITYLLS